MLPVYNPGADIGINVAVTGPSARPDLPLRVEFYQGKTSLGTDSTAPYSLVWKGAANGKYLVRAVLFQQDAAIATTHTESRTVWALNSVASAEIFPANPPPGEGGGLHWNDWLISREMVHETFC